MTQRELRIIPARKRETRLLPRGFEGVLVLSGLRIVGRGAAKDGMYCRTDDYVLMGRTKFLQSFNQA